MRTKEQIRAYTQKYERDNREKINTRQRQLRASKPKHFRDWIFKRKYGISVEDYDVMRRNQDSRCAICRTSEPGGKGTHPDYAFYVDHDHQTGVVRGLLCHHCNVALGYLKDSLTSLNSAIQYLTNPPALKCIGAKGTRGINS